MTIHTDIRSSDTDPALSGLPDALSPDRASRELVLHEIIPGTCVVRTAALLDLVPGRYAAIQYEVETGAGGRLVLNGYISAGDETEIAHHNLCYLRQHGFDQSARDHIRVPDPAGSVPTLRMKVYRMAAGVPASSVLYGPTGSRVAARIGEALSKLHRTEMPVLPAYTLEDEFQLVERSLRRVSSQRPSIASRLERLARTCARIADGIMEGSPVLSHGSFRADKVWLSSEDLVLEDLAHCVRGDRGLDAGSFLAGLLVEVLRAPERREAIQDAGRAFMLGYAARSGGIPRAAVRGFTTLALARQIEQVIRQQSVGDDLAFALIGACERRAERHLQGQPVS